MMLPKVTSWTNADGKTHHWVMVIHVDLYCQCNGVCAHEDVIHVYAPPFALVLIKRHLSLDTFRSPKRVLMNLWSINPLLQVDAERLHADYNRRNVDVLKQLIFFSESV